MFTQLFILVIALLGIILGIKDGNYLCALCGFMMLAVPSFFFYQSKVNNSVLSTKTTPNT
ncbi:hypothetical protein JQC92_04430 [Shewanella sp. 202IG2-18]|uniref:hypothetical protein n=1 Tax=Parashewanella hymeniacidonis TaxID=2807618 RepID=UPI00195F9D11|nr:hypothetical protein [Parashewanella hymeniacidonis]MBM7071288.1 hypothetical protein [Parashewanella hymeniacidonis]